MADKGASWPWCLATSLRNSPGYLADHRGCCHYNSYGLPEPPLPACTPCPDPTVNATVALHRFQPGRVPFFPADFLPRTGLSDCEYISPRGLWRAAFLTANPPPPERKKFEFCAPCNNDYRYCKSVKELASFCDPPSIIKLPYGRRSTCYN